MSCTAVTAWRRLVILCTAISRKAVGKNVEAVIPKGNMGSDQYTVPKPDTVAVEPTFIAFLALAKISLWPVMQFFQIFSKNNEPQTTHNTLRDCRVHFCRQPFSK